MNECFEKARELGQMVLQTELADRVRIARQISDINQIDEIALADANSKFEEFFEQVVAVFKATVTGEFPAAENHGGCGGGCCSSKR